MKCISGAAGHLATNPYLNRGWMDAILEFYTFTLILCGDARV